MNARFNPSLTILVFLDNWMRFRDRSPCFYPFLTLLVFVITWMSFWERNEFHPIFPSIWVPRTQVTQSISAFFSSVFSNWFQSLFTTLKTPASAKFVRQKCQPKVWVKLHLFRTCWWFCHGLPVKPGYRLTVTGVCKLPLSNTWGWSLDEACPEMALEVDWVFKTLSLTTLLRKIMHQNKCLLFLW